jgi:hypothetical protein
MGHELLVRFLATGDRMACLQSDAEITVEEILVPFE